MAGKSFLHLCLVYNLFDYPLSLNGVLLLLHLYPSNHTFYYTYRQLCVSVIDPATTCAKGSITASNVSSGPTNPTNGTKSTKINTINTKAIIASKANKADTIATTTAVHYTETELTHTTPRRTLFYDMLTTLARDAFDFRSLLCVMIHFMQQTLSLQSGSKCDDTPAATTINDTTNNNSELMYKIEPMVLIADQNRVTKMVCPALYVIEQHSTKLAALVKVILQVCLTSCSYLFPFMRTCTTASVNVFFLFCQCSSIVFECLLSFSQNAMEKQIGAAVQSIRSNANNTSSSSGADMEKQLVQVLKKMDDSYFVTLQGSYNMWQEVCKCVILCDLFVYTL